MKQRYFSNMLSIAKLYVAGLALLVLALSVVVTGANAQSTARIHHTITTANTGIPLLGRDVWFTMCQNYDAGGQNGKVDEIMATSPNATTIHISIGPHGSSYAFPIQANQVEIFKVPLAWEVNTSGIVENKAIRVWSNDADVCVYLLSFNPYTSEGMYVLPTIGWGTNYTVAAYAGLFELTFDYPSEYAIVTNQNNTTVVSTPSCDIRTTGLPNTVLHPALAPFSESLNQGQCTQYVSILSQNCENYDFTGTLLQSNVPIGVVGASQCPNIPCDYPYCDFVCEMTPPRRTWVDQYFTMPTEARGQNNGDTFLVIGSQNGQTVYIDDPKQGPNIVFCQVNNNSTYWFDAVQNPERFWSTAPFELLQYENSSTWDNSSIGDAAMTTINGLEQYTPEIVFQTPTPTGLPYDFTNYVNIICPAGVGANTKLDGVPMPSYHGASKVVFYSTQYEGYLISSIKPGTHILQCDASNPANVVGAYIYGYGSYDSYFWPGGMGNKTFNNQDTFPPIVDTMGACFCAHVTANDYIHPVDTHIATMNLDSLTNMYYTPDLNYNAGTLMDSTFYDLCVFDSTKPAYARVTIFDYAGNSTTVTSTYVPQTAVLQPLTTNFGIGNLGGPAILDSVWIKNTGQVGFQLDTLYLKNKKQGFTLAKPIPTGVIPVGDSVKVYVNFIPVAPTNNVDTIVAGDACILQNAYLVGNGGKPDFSVTGYEFGCIQIGSSATTGAQNVEITNPATIALQIDSIWVDDPAEFKFTGTVPIIVPAGGHAYAPFTFTPLTANPYIATVGHFDDFKDGIIHTDSLIGCGINPLSSFVSDQGGTQICGGGGSVIYQFTVANTSVALDTVNKITSAAFPAGTASDWSVPVLTDPSGNVLTPPQIISNGAGDNSKLNLTVTFTVPVKTAGIFCDTLYVLDGHGSPIPQTAQEPYVVIRDTVVYRELDTDVAPVIFPTQPYGGAQVQQTFQVTNTGPDPVTVTALTPNGPDQASFKVITPLPFTVAPGNSQGVTVQFDPSVSAKPSQNATVLITSNACQQTAKFATASLSFGPPTAKGFAIPAILSCTTQEDSVYVTNSNNPGPGGVVTIVSVTSSSPNFTPLTAGNITVQGGSQQPIPVLFAPTPGGGSTVYNGMIYITITDQNGTTYLDSAAVTGTGVGYNATVSSVFGGTKNGAAGDAATLPITVNVNKNGQAQPLTAAGIYGVTLIYTYNQDELSLPGNSNTETIQNAPAGWSGTATLTANAQNVATLTVQLKGTSALADNMNSLGNLNFQVMLSKYEFQRFNVTLDTAIFLDQNGQTYAGCLAAKTTYSDFGLVYTCGDSSLGTILNGGTIAGFAEPVHPNPATTGGAVSIGYAVRANVPVTLSIYDMLGKEVERVLDAVPHAAGVYQAVVDVSKLPSGTYNAYLSVPNWNGSQQFVISK